MALSYIQNEIVSISYAST